MCICVGPLLLTFGISFVTFFSQISNNAAQIKAWAFSRRSDSPYLCLFVVICGVNPANFGPSFLFFPFVRPKFCRNPANFGPSFLFCPFLFLFFSFLFLFFPFHFFFLSSSFPFVFVWPKFCRKLANFGPSFLFFFSSSFSFLLFGPNFAETRQILGRHSFSVLSSSFSFLSSSFSFLSFSFFFLSSSFSFFLFGPNFAGTRQILGRHSIADEEAAQFRTLNLLYSIFQLRGCPKPEGCHGLWNSFK